MSQKRDRIDAVITKFQGRDLDARYLGYFECFNRQHFYEAHEVLEELWLTERGGPRDRFYKALIQLAGAFVHLQKNRPQPAMALLRLAQTNLEPYPAIYKRLDLAELRRLMTEWLRHLKTLLGAQSSSSAGYSSLARAEPELCAPPVWPPKLFLAHR